MRTAADESWRPKLAPSIVNGCWPAAGKFGLGGSATEKIFSRCAATIKMGASNVKSACRVASCRCTVSEKTAQGALKPAAGWLMTAVSLIHSVATAADSMLRDAADVCITAKEAP